MVDLRRRQTGFTYLALLIGVAIVGMAGAATLKIDALMARAAAEQELLEIGAAFSAALDSYAAVTPPGASPYPPSLKELLRDPRVPGVRRHLRRIFVDPLTGKAEWGVVMLGEGAAGVVAVHSLSTARPLKLANFDSRFTGLENADTIAAWRFKARDPKLEQAPPAPPPGAQPGKPAAPLPPAAPADPVLPPSQVPEPELQPDPEGPAEPVQEDGETPAPEEELLPTPEVT